ncbi:MAG TPA: MATE family efflux transporter [Edaphocola sp.]|nr:MATE family efflux transporter [Edaphocola sp.]
MSIKSESLKTGKLAIPLILGEIAQIILHMLDLAMIGALGANSYQQVAASALVFNVIIIPFVIGIGISMSVSQMVSLANGKGDDKLVSHYFFNGFWLCAFLAILISFGIEMSQDFILSYGGNQEKEVTEMAKPFMRVMGISIIPMILFMTLKQFTDGLEYTKIAMVLSFASVPINAFINWLLIFGNWGFPRMEMMGAAYGTLITRTLIFIALGYVVLNHKVFKKYIDLKKTEWHFKWKTIKELLHIGIPSGLQFGLEAGVFAFSAILIFELFGARQMAAHQVAMQCASFTYMISTGLSQAGAIRVSNAFGRKDWVKISTIGKSNLIISMSYGIICALFFFLLRDYLPLIFLEDSGKGSGGNNEVIVIASNLLLLAAIFQLSDTSQAISAGLLRGIKDVKVPTFLMFFGYWVISLPIGYWMATEQNFQTSGIWWGFIIGLTFTSITLTSRFFIKIKNNVTKNK